MYRIHKKRIAGELRYKLCEIIRNRDEDKVKAEGCAKVKRIMTNVMYYLFN